MTYVEKLKDPKWQKRRLDIMGRDKFTCQRCLSEDQMLVVHHLSYKGDPWEATDEMLITLCEDCHNEEHEAKKKLGKASEICASANILNLDLLYLLDEMLARGAIKNIDFLNSSFIAFALTDLSCMTFIRNRYFDRFTSNENPF